MAEALSVILPANNEAGYIGPCLAALAAQVFDTPVQRAVIVAANACTDTTLAEAEEARAQLEAAGWDLHILDLSEPGKINALNRAEARAQGGIRVYLDADVICEPPLMQQLLSALDGPAPRYASGTLKVAPARSWVTRRFATIWTRLPFMTTNVQGAGLFAVNAAGRARWGDFPDLIADDAYVRLLFAPEERIRVDAAYHWPLVEGFVRLVRVRRRQDAGVQELAATFPELMANESKPPLTPGDHLRLFLGAPVSYAVYVSVILAVRSGGNGSTAWVRGR